VAGETVQGRRPEPGVGPDDHTRFMPPGTRQSRA